jgi:hypothetical protein
MYYCKGKMYSAVNFYFDDIVVNVVTILEKSKFSLTFYIKKRVVTKSQYKKYNTQLGI